MLFGLVRRMHLWSLLAGAGWLGLAALPANAQIFHRGGQYCPPPPTCPTPAPTHAETPPALPPSTPPTEPATPAAPQAPTVDLSAVAPESLFAGGGETTAFAPNMMGDLLYGSRSISFDYQSLISGAGATSVVNPKVAENNSPQPRDRVSYRYNFFNDALQITGSSSQLGQAGFTVPTFNSATKLYDDNLHTFAIEKTFFDRLMSLELRA